MSMLRRCFHIAASLLVLTACFYTISSLVTTHVAQMDSAPVFVTTEEPVVLTPYVHIGDEVRVLWSGYYRKACASLQYTRWVGLYDSDGRVVELKKPNVQSSSSVETEPGEFVFSWVITYPLKPGVYFWRSIEIAECTPGVIITNHLDDAWFEIVPFAESTSVSADARGAPE